MKTEFSLAQLADPDIAEADKILRACVHCGFCTATCPTYVLLGDELDSPRGRIYLIKEMLEKDKPPTPSSGCGWKTSTFRLVCSDARISEAWPPAASTR